jgi:lipoprotein-releasing system ATP-binding protein
MAHAIATEAGDRRARHQAAAPTTTTLELRGVHHRFALGRQDLHVLRGIDLDVAPGEIVAIVGRSGSGKSTLLHVAGGLTAPMEGDVRILGRSLAAMKARDRAIVRRHEVGFVFQAFHLLPGLDVVDNVTMPLLLDGTTRARAEREARPLLESVGLGERVHHLPSELSGGELQRAAIARALIAAPTLVLADEPTGNLDSATADDVIDLLTARVRDAGVAMVLVTHDPLIAARADRVLTMADGVLT